MLALKNARLIDGTGKKALENAALLIDGSRIAAVGQGIQSPGAEEIDLGGMTLLPGLVESHIHIGGAFDREATGLTGSSNFYEAARKKLIDCGVTTVRSAGDFAEDILQLRDRTAAGELIGPRVYAPGKFMQAAGGHPLYTVWGGHADIEKYAATCPGTVEEAIAEVSAQSRAGVDHVKTVLSDDNPSDPRKKSPKLSPEIFRAIVAEARRHNLKVLVHAETPEDALFALQCGAGSIEHLICGGWTPGPLPAGLADAFLRSGAFCVPTMAITYYHSAAEPERPSNLPHVFKAVKLLSDAGVNLAVGTDSGASLVPVGDATHKELELMVEAGIAPLKVIQYATKSGAELVGSRDFGTLEAGKLADIIAVEGNPLEDIRTTKNVRLVIKEGKILKNTL